MSSKFIWLRRVALIALTCSFVVVGFTVRNGQAGARNFQQPAMPPALRLISPKPGDVLHPGDQVTIQWEVDSSGDARPIGCEQEIFLSLDRGKTVAARLSSELSPTTFSYQWMVPNLPSKKAVLILNYGCETGSSVFESSQPQKKAVFRILPAPASFEEVVLDSVDKSVSNPRQLSVRWHSTASNVESYEVELSYDRGAHFTSVGHTSDQEFTWNVASELSGSLTFRVIAHRTDGSNLESVTNTNLSVVFGRGQ